MRLGVIWWAIIGGVAAAVMASAASGQEHVEADWVRLQSSYKGVPGSVRQLDRSGPGTYYHAVADQLLLVTGGGDSFGYGFFDTGVAVGDGESAGKTAGDRYTGLLDQPSYGTADQEISIIEWGPDFVEPDDPTVGPRAWIQVQVRPNPDPAFAYPAAGDLMYGTWILTYVYEDTSGVRYERAWDDLSDTYHYVTLKDGGRISGFAKTKHGTYNGPDLAYPTYRWSASDFSNGEWRNEVEVVQYGPPYDPDDPTGGDPPPDEPGVTDPPDDPGGGETEPPDDGPPEDPFDDDPLAPAETGVACVDEKLAETAEGPLSSFVKGFGIEGGSGVEMGFEFGEVGGVAIGATLDTSFSGSQLSASMQALQAITRAISAIGVTYLAAMGLAKTQAFW